MVLAAAHRRRGRRRRRTFGDRGRPGAPGGSAARRPAPLPRRPGPARRPRRADRNCRLAPAADPGADRVAGARQGRQRVLAAGPPSRAAQRPHRLDLQRPYPGHLDRMEHPGRPFGTAGHRVPTRHRGATVLRRGREALDPDSARTVLRRRGRGAGSLGGRGPYALATSARSNVFQEFEGGPGQIALHGRNHLSGALGSASSHGCVRLGTAAIVWLARRIGAGTPLVIRH